MALSIKIEKREILLFLYPLVLLKMSKILGSFKRNGFVKSVALFLMNNIVENNFTLKTSGFWQNHPNLEDLTKKALEHRFFYVFLFNTLSNRSSSCSSHSGSFAWFSDCWSCPDRTPVRKSSLPLGTLDLMGWYSRYSAGLAKGFHYLVWGAPEGVPSAELAHYCWCAWLDEGCKKKGRLRSFARAARTWLWCGRSGCGRRPSIAPAWISSLVRNMN